MRKSVLLFALLIAMLSMRSYVSAQSGSIYASNNDTLTYQIVYLNDVYQNRTLFGYQVSENDTFTVTVVDDSYSSDNTIDVQINLNSHIISTTDEVDKLDFILIPDWNYWSNYFGTQYFSYDSSGNINIQFGFSDSGYFYYFAFAYSPTGILIAYYVYIAEDTNQTNPFYAIEYDLIDQTVPLTTNTFDVSLYGIEANKEYEYVLTTYDTQSTAPFFQTQNDQLYLFEGDHFTVKIRATPNNQGQIPLTITSGSDSITYVDDMTSLGSFVVYIDYESWINILDDEKANLGDGEFLDYSLDNIFKIHYVGNSGGDSLEWTMEYNYKSGVLEHYEVVADIQGQSTHIVVDIVKSKSSRIIAITPFILLSGFVTAVVIQRRKNKSLL